MKKKPSVARGRMTQAHINAVVAEIEAHSRGERDGILSWARLADFSGFSHVALWQKKPIKEAFQRAKALRSGNRAADSRRTVDERIAVMQSEIDRLRDTIRVYDELWSLYEYNLHRLGLNSDDLRRPLDAVNRRDVRSPRQSKSRW